VGTCPQMPLLHTRGVHTGRGGFEQRALFLQRRFVACPDCDAICFFSISTIIRLPMYSATLDEGWITGGGWLLCRCPPFCHERRLSATAPTLLRFEAQRIFRRACRNVDHRGLAARCVIGFTSGPNRGAGGVNGRTSLAPTPARPTNVAPTGLSSILSALRLRWSSQEPGTHSQ
jgi:hypothetical protein